MEGPVWSGIKVGFRCAHQEVSGVGLGLSVSYGIVQDHGGQISVNSTLEQGTTFRIAFPAVPARQQVAAD